jgi:subtilase family serine protease
MKISKVNKLLFLSGAAAFTAGSIYAQATPFAVVPASSVPSGFYRPFIWSVSVASPAGLVHGPGQTCTGSPNVCYYFPSDIVTAYSTAFIANGNGGLGTTVAIVDAYYNPQTEADLGSFNTFFGLPACTIANTCLTIVNQTGGAPSAGFNEGWAQETNLDVQWVHAMAPKAKILLVTGNSNSFADLGAAVQYAQAHADVISNSYGANEFAGETSFDTFYSTSTIPILFSSGDTGATAEYPCASTFVTCVGGTHLLTTSASYRNVESVWGDGTVGDEGSSGGCSTQITAPAWQTGYSTALCGTARGMPDIAALADPLTGAIVYLGTSAAGGTAGFYDFGGTSLACPLTAGLIANIDTARVTAGKSKLGANLPTLIYQAAANPYYHYRFYDVTTGSSGFAAVSGWDRATGLGVPLFPALTSYLVGLP